MTQKATDGFCNEECFTPTRRAFNALLLGASVAAVASNSSAATAGLSVKETDVTFKTSDGTCDAAFIHPAAGSYPGVLLWTDAAGLRPVFREMGKRLASEGYAVLIPNPFYRTATAPLVLGMKGPDRGKIFGQIGAVGAIQRDSVAHVTFLESQSAVKKSSKIGTIGYCMGGGLTMEAAATVPERIGAMGSFHGGVLVTDEPTSRHLLVPKIKAHSLICIAENDDMKKPDAKETLRAAFIAVNNPADIEVYKGTKHGWCVPGDSIITGLYDETQAEKAWAKLLAHFSGALT